MLCITIKQLKIAIYGSVIANVLLFGLQLVAAIKSGSLSIFSTMIDAFMDLLSSVVLMWASRQASKSNITKYPAVRSSMYIYASFRESEKKK